MGNTESTGLKMCSGNSLYTYTGDRTSLKEQMNMQRVGYQPKHKAKPQVKAIPAPQYRKQVSQQQMGQRQRQQQQEGFKLQNRPLEIEVTATQQEQLEAHKDPTFNVYLDCVRDKLADDLPLPPLEENETEDLAKDMKDRNMECFDGLFGNVIVHSNGLILYTDINGGKFCEEFDAGSAGKCFPLGITGGELSKSIWFNDVIERDSCFDAMTARLEDISVPPSYEEVVANADKYTLLDDSETVMATCSSPVAGFAASSLSYSLVDATDSETEEESDNPDDHIKVFEGLGGMQVIVHEDNLVLFTDINGTKHCQNYNPHNLNKVFPSGISGGGLPKSIWFDDGQERDLCYALMQWNMDEVDEAMEVEPEPQEFEGLYGNVTLKHNGEIEYTSLTGEEVVSTFDTETLSPTFPMGISYGGLPKTIWFDSPDDRQAALKAMREQ